MSVRTESIVLDFFDMRNASVCLSKGIIVVLDGMAFKYSTRKSILPGEFSLRDHVSLQTSSLQ